MPPPTPRDRAQIANINYSSMQRRAGRTMHAVQSKGSRPCMHIYSAAQRQIAKAAILFLSLDQLIGPFLMLGHAPPLDTRNTYADLDLTYGTRMC